MLNNVMGMIVDFKVKFTDIAIELLPERVRPEAFRLRTEALDCLHDKLSSFQENRPKVAKNTTIRKITLD